LKERLAAIARINVDTLPIDKRVVALAETAALMGRDVALATAADAGIAQAVARRFPFITRVMASHVGHNLKGTKKAAALSAAFPQGFDYAGDSAADLEIFAKARQIILVRASSSVETRARSLGKPTLVIHRDTTGFSIWLRALRIKQWAKNTLVFAPIALAGHLMSLTAWWQASLAFIGLSCIASATYLVNDLVDIGHDREHWSKCRRPLASGELPIRHCLLAAPMILAAGLALLALVGNAVLLGGLLYIVTTVSYSFGLKRIPIIDVFTLAGLFSLRILIGSLAIGAVLSPWLFVFSMALFLSLSVAKRHTELSRSRLQNKTMEGRGYRAADEPLLLAMGITTAVSSVVILILYLVAEGFRAGQYEQPAFLWGAPAIIFIWQMRIWLLSQRGELDDDPVAFAIRDQPSIQLGASLVMVVLAAYFGVKLPWF
jgi:4-hydroxybenzoate polyprenyltransferase